MTVDNDCKFSAAFFDALAELANALLKNELAIYEASYNYWVFGSWTLVAGTSHHRLRFDFDGKEDLLEVCESRFDNSASQSRWRPVKTHQLQRGTGVNTSRVFSIVESLAVETFRN